MMSTKTSELKNEKEGHQMDADKRQRYEKISMELTRLAGGRENIQGVAHCATRLRIVLTDNDKLYNQMYMENCDLNIPYPDSLAQK